MYIHVTNIYIFFKGLSDRNAGNRLNGRLNWLKRGLVCITLLMTLTEYFLLSYFNISREYNTQPGVYFTYTFTNTKRGRD